jgi:hypothetical protein
MGERRRGRRASTCWRGGDGGQAHGDVDGREAELMAAQRRGRLSSPWHGGEEDRALGGTAEWEDELIAA